MLKFLLGRWITKIILKISCLICSVRSQATLFSFWYFLFSFLFFFTIMTHGLVLYTAPGHLICQKAPLLKTGHSLRAISCERRRIDKRMVVHFKHCPLYGTAEKDNNWTGNKILN